MKATLLGSTRLLPQSILNLVLPLVLTVKRLCKSTFNVDSGFSVIGNMSQRVQETFIIDSFLYRPCVEHLVFASVVMLSPGVTEMIKYGGQEIHEQRA